MDTPQCSGPQTAELSSLPNSHCNVTARISDDPYQPPTHESRPAQQQPANDSCPHGSSPNLRSQHQGKCPSGQPVPSDISSAYSPTSIAAVHEKSLSAKPSTRGRVIPFPVAGSASVTRTDQKGTWRSKPAARKRGKSMSRRRGQSGHLEMSGKWWIVRWWMDVPGQDKRALKRAKVCPISGAGSLSKSARERRAKEIIAESGADTVEYFNKAMAQNTSCLTLREQGEIWFTSQQLRKRKPLAPSTLDGSRYYLDTWIYPYLGDLPLSAVHNITVRPLVAAMSGLSASTITHVVQTVKMVVASVKDDHGEEELYPRKWSPETMDMPILDASTQNTPTFSPEIISGLARWHHRTIQMLFILCGATGFRISEALGIEIGKHISADLRTIKIEQQAYECKLTSRLKSANAYREVDLHSSVAALLKEFVGERRSGFLFQSRWETPLALNNILRRHLHPALANLGYVNHATGTHKAGSHAFRRFRDTYLKNNIECPCPSGLLKFWLGHARSDMSERYDKVMYDRELRLKWAEKCGIGFDLPQQLEPKVPTGRQAPPVLSGGK